MSTALCVFGVQAPEDVAFNHLINFKKLLNVADAADESEGERERGASSLQNLNRPRRIYVRAVQLNLLIGLTTVG